MPRPGPEPGDQESPIQVLAVVFRGNLGCLLICPLRILVRPLLLVGKEGHENATNHDAGYDKVGRGPTFDRAAGSRRKAGGKENEVGGCGDGEEKNRLEQRYEGDVEDEKDWRRNLAAKDLPAVVFAADLISTFSPVIEREPDLRKGEARVNGDRGPGLTIQALTLQMTLAATRVSRRSVSKPIR